MTNMGIGVSIRYLGALEDGPRLKSRKTTGTPIYLKITGSAVDRVESKKKVVAPAKEGGLTTEEYLKCMIQIRKMLK